MVVGSSGSQDLRLFFIGEVLPGEGGIDDFLIHLEDFVVGNGTRVGQVDGSSDLTLGHVDHDGKEFRKDSHGVSNGADFLVFGDLGNEITGVVGTSDGHSDSSVKDVTFELLH